VQLDPIKPTLKAPGMRPLKLTYDKPLSNFAFKFNLRRYMKAEAPSKPTMPPKLLYLSEVGRCKLTLSNPH